MTSPTRDPRNDAPTAPGKVGWIDSPVFDGHRTPSGHPECVERLAAVREAIAARNLERHVERVLADAIDTSFLGQLYGDTHLRALASQCRSESDAGLDLDPDTHVVSASWPAALHAAGAAVQAVEAVLAGRWRRAFCSVRPPGHHANAAQARGFCLLNNVAIAAEAARCGGQCARVAIVDWDVHHGNGTQDIFWERADVLVASAHQYPFYPGTGAKDEVGDGAGRGFTVNCPLAQGSGDDTLWAAWETVIRPNLDAFGPDLVLISAGFDADARDPLGGLTVTPRGFAALSTAVVRWTDEHCEGRLVSLLEGGYDLTALGEDAALHLETLT